MAPGYSSVSLMTIFFSARCGHQKVVVKNILVSVNGAVKHSKFLLKYDLDGGLYPDLQPCGLSLAS